MIFISKFLTAFLMPPGLIIVILFVFLFLCKSKIGFAIIIAFLYVLSIDPIADSLLRPLEDKYPALSLDNIRENDPTAIVVLGGGTIIASPESEGDSLSSDALKRAVYAFTLRDTFSVPYIFSGGKVFDYGQDTEADVAKQLFISLGMSPDRIIVESKSRNTWQNAKETAKLNHKEVILVTSAYHIPRSVYCFEKNGMNVIPAPTDYKINREKPYDFFSFMPSINALSKTYLAMHEYVGLLYARIFYR